MKVLPEASTAPRRSGRREPNGAVRPRLELGPLAERLGYFLRRAQVAIFQDFDVAFEAVDIRPVQYSILTIIEGNPGLSQTRVCEALGIKKTNFVAMLDVLEARALVRRVPTPGDRRTYALHLTETGRSFMRKLHRLAEAHEGRIIARIGEEAHRRMFAELRAIAALGRDIDRDKNRARTDGRRRGAAKR